MTQISNTLKFKPMKNSILLFLLMAIYGHSSANNVQVTNVNVSGNLITFDVSWDNSWRTSSISPNNYDGVWVFCKYRKCEERPTVISSAPSFSHMWLSTNSGDHVVPGASYTLGNTTIGGTPRGMGVFIYRSADGSGTFSSTGVTLKWDDISQGCVGCNVDVQVMAIEMVYIPQGNFQIGDGIGGSGYRFSSDAAFNVPYTVTSEALINLNAAGGLFMSGTPFSGTPIPAAFPKGFDGFWCMKYEVSQEQYVAFLNSLSRGEQVGLVSTPIGIGTTTAANTFVLSNTFTPVNRNGIRLASPFSNSNVITFFNDLDNDNIPNEANDGQNIACNWISASDLRAYLDWSALRPISEMEYEKICRGPNTPLATEYAWGLAGSNFLSQTSINNPGLGTELAAPDGAGAVTCCNILGGPVRTGENFTPTSDRYSAGAAYYGVADMSGNLWELCITTYDAASRVYTGEHGDGNYSTTIPTWVLNDSYGVRRGGSWFQTNGYLRVSERSITTPTANTRSNEFGIRGVRK